MRNFAEIVLVALGATMISGSALAGPAVTHVPEPISLSLMAGGVLAIAAVKHWRRK